MKTLSIFLFLVAAFLIVGLAVLIAPGYIKNIYFWITVGWLVFLSAINWIASTFIFIGASGSNNSSSKFGILPSLNIIIFIYSLFSGVFLLSTWFINDFGILPNWHLISQLIIFSFVSFLSILMFLASKAASTDKVDTLLSKEDLIKILKSIYSTADLDEEKKELIKEVLEVIQYSLPHLSKLNSQENYNSLCSLYKNLNFNDYKNINKEDIKKSLLLAKNS
ncbi:hypothetical protein OAV49_01090 [Alphaproteobacteria bacterium]|nr:hypothetical protein [Alphaproteobacteria bacterium]